MAERAAQGIGRLAVRMSAIAAAGIAVAVTLWLGSGLDLGRFAFLGEGSRLAGDMAAEQVAFSASAQSSRIGTVHADAEAFWTREIRTGRTPSRLVFFSGSMPSPCAGRGGATGHFHCAADRVAGFDLVHAAETEGRLREAADAGQALIVGRIVAGGAIVAAGSRGGDPTLQGDCMTGVWAGSAFGVMDPGLYERAIIATRRSADALMARGPDAPDILNDFALGDPKVRDAAFRAGAASGDPDICAAF